MKKLVLALSIAAITACSGNSNDTPAIFPSAEAGELEHNHCGEDIVNLWDAIEYDLTYSPVDTYAGEYIFLGGQAYRTTLVTLRDYVTGNRYTISLPVLEGEQLNLQYIRVQDTNPCTDETIAGYPATYSFTTASTLTATPGINNSDVFHASVLTFALSIRVDQTLIKFSLPSRIVTQKNVIPSEGDYDLTDNMPVLTNLTPHISVIDDLIDYIHITAQ